MEGQDKDLSIGIIAYVVMLQIQIWLMAVRKESWSPLHSCMFGFAMPITKSYSSQSDYKTCQRCQLDPWWHRNITPNDTSRHRLHDGLQMPFTRFADIQQLKINLTLLQNEQTPWTSYLVLQISTIRPSWTAAVECPDFDGLSKSLLANIHDRNFLAKCRLRESPSWNNIPVNYCTGQ